MTNEEKNSAFDKFEEKELDEKEMNSVKGGLALKGNPVQGGEIYIEINEDEP
jgi:natural product precursor